MSHTLPRTIEENIKQFGWHVNGVFDPEGDTPPFAYTVGATSRNLPEIIIVGLSPKTSCILINELLRSVQDAREIIREDTPYTELANMPCYLRKLTPKQIEDHMTFTCAYHGTDTFDAYQLVYPDPKGLMPWEDGYSFPPQTLLFQR